MTKDIGMSGYLTKEAMIADHAASLRAEWKFTEQNKERDGESIGSGFFVFRRGKKTNRISVSGSRKKMPFEHPTFNSAFKEAVRLKRENPNEVYVVFAEISDLELIIDYGSTTQPPKPSV